MLGEKMFASATIANTTGFTMPNHWNCKTDDTVMETHRQLQADVKLEVFKTHKERGTGIYVTNVDVGYAFTLLVFTLHQTKQT